MGLLPPCARISEAFSVLARDRIAGWIFNRRHDRGDCFCNALFITPVFIFGSPWQDIRTGVPFSTRRSGMAYRLWSGPERLHGFPKWAAPVFVARIGSSRSSTARLGCWRLCQPSRGVPLLVFIELLEDLAKTLTPETPWYQRPNNTRSMPWRSPFGAGDQAPRRPLSQPFPDGDSHGHA